ncbi:hypothetical protein Tco_0327386 [Tanacetum coccineum]
MNTTRTKNAIQVYRSHEATFPKGNTSGSTEDSLNLKELMDIVPKLVLRIDNLEKELQQTKSTYRKAVLTLVERVKLLKAALKRKSRKGRHKRKILVLQPWKQLKFYRRLLLRIAAKERLNSAEVKVNTEVNPGSVRVNTGNTPVSTPSVIQTMNVIVPSLVKSQREGKAPMTSEDVQATQKIKEQIRQC